MYMKRYRWLLALLITLLAGLIAVVLVMQHLDADPEGQLIATGTIEVTEVRIGFRMQGTLTQRAVDEGDAVRQGALIATLDSREIQSRLYGAEAGVRLAQATLSELEKGFRPEEVAQAEAAVSEAAVQAKNLKAQAERSSSLYAEGGLSREQRDRDVTAAAAADSRHRAALEKLRLMRSGYRSEQIAAARARLEQAQAAVDTLRVTLADMTAVSPIGGVVTRTHAEVGETLSAVRPVATIADLSKPWLRVYIPERQLGRVRLGDKAEVAVDAYPDRRFPGRVSFISSQAEFTPKNVQTREERVKLVFAVDVRLENEEGILMPGMPADVWIHLRAASPQTR